MADSVKLFLPLGVLVVLSVVFDPAGWRRASMALPMVFAVAAAAVLALSVWTRRSKPATKQ